jgi:hypothetical protein
MPSAASPDEFGTGTRTIASFKNPSEHSRPQRRGHPCRVKRCDRPGTELLW